MLLPALSKAREKARNISCVNNLKQVGLGAFMFADATQKDMLPSVLASENAESTTITGGSYRQSWAGALNDYVNNPKVFMCPAEADGCVKSWTGNIHENLSYGANPSRNGKDNKPLPIVLAAIEDPSECVLYGDITNGVTAATSSSNTAEVGVATFSFHTHTSAHATVGSETLEDGDVDIDVNKIGKLAARHGERFNVVLGDGHAEGAGYKNVGNFKY